MNDDELDRHLPEATKGAEEGPEPTTEFRRRLLEETSGELPAARGRVARIRSVVTAVAAAALLVASMLVFGPGGPGAVRVDDPGGDGGKELLDDSRLAAARGVPAFAAEESRSLLYENPVEYLRTQGVDVTVAGLVDLWRRLAAGEETGIEAGKWAVLDALSERSGDAFAPLLTGLWDMDPDAGARRYVLLMLRRARDRVVAPWLDARLADAPADLIRDVARTRVALHLPDSGAAAALRSRCEALGLLDPASGSFVASAAPDLLYSLHALGDPAALDDFGRALAAAPTVDLLRAAYSALGDRPEPPALAAARDALAAAALAKEEPGYDEVRLLDVLGQAGDDRFVPLLRRLLEDDYVPLAVEAARTAGAWRVEEAWSDLVMAWKRAVAMGEEGLDLVPPTLWAAARCGDAQAIPRLADFLRDCEWYRAGEWAVDALVDLGVPVGSIVLLLPDETFSVGKLPMLLDRVTMEDRDEIEAKIASLPDGPLRSALVFARDLGAGPDVRDYLRAVSRHGGNLGLYLTFSDPERVRTTLEGGAGDHDAVMALRAVPLLPRPEADRRELAAGALASGRPRVRAAAARALVRLGGEAAVAVLRDRLGEEESPFVRERIAIALADLGIREARELYLGAVPEGSFLARALAREDLYDRDPKALLARVTPPSDPIGAGYRLVFELPRRRAKPDPAGDLFDYEELR